MSPFIVTLAAMAAWRGTTYAISGRDSGGDSVQAISNNLLISLDGYYGQVPRAFVYLVVLAVAAWWVMARTKFGRDLYSVGGNERAAFLAGINVAAHQDHRVRHLGAVLRRRGADPHARGCPRRRRTSVRASSCRPSPRPWSAESASPAGSAGRSARCIGAFLIGTIYIGMQLENVTTYAQPVVAGVILIGAVGYDRFRRVRDEKKAGLERERLRPMLAVEAVVNPDAPTVLEARGLSKRYGAVQALSSADLLVHAGEVHALMGTNGAGKSTLDQDPHRSCRAGRGRGQARRLARAAR